MTTIERSEAGLFVYKRALASEANSIISRIFKNQQAIVEYIGDYADVALGEMTDENEIRYPFLNLPSLQWYINELVDSGDLNRVKELIDDAVVWIRSLPAHMQMPYAQEHLRVIYGSTITVFDCELPCLDIGIIDVTADNLLYDSINKRYTLVDHELLLPGCIPVDFVVFRFLFYVILRIQNSFDAFADGIPLKLSIDNIVRVPEEWNMAAWIDTDLFKTYVQMEENLQGYYTGHVQTWPRPTYYSDTLSRRVNRNVSDQLSAATRERDEIRAQFDDYIRSTDHVFIEYKKEVDKRGSDIEEIAKERQKLWEEYNQYVQHANNTIRVYQEKEGKLIEQEKALQLSNQQLLDNLSLSEHKLALARTALRSEQRASQLKAHHLGTMISGLERRVVASQSVQAPPQSFKSEILSVMRRLLRGLHWRIQALRTRVLTGAKSRVKRLLGRANAHSSVRPSEYVDVPYRHMVLNSKAAWPGPLFSIVVSHTLTEQHNEVLNWLSQQTFPSYEVIFWDAEQGRAWSQDEAELYWNVDDVAELRSTLLGRYVIVATTALLHAPLTYLEINALALEGEDLEYTLNSFSRHGDAYSMMCMGFGPGAVIEQRALIVMQTELLGDQLQFDPALLPSRTETAYVAARFITHEASGAPEQLADWHYPLTSSEWESNVQEGYLVIRSKERGYWGQFTHILYQPPEVLMRPTPPTKQLKRVLVVMPFIAVGGAERITLDVLGQLQDRFEPIIITTDPLAPTAGSMKGEFQQLTPYVYTLPDFISSLLTFPVFSWVIEYHQIDVLFVANGTGWIYDAVSELRNRYPHLRMINQVYDHKIGWINRYDSVVASAFDHHIAPNRKIARAYIDHGVPEEHISLIYHGVDVSIFDKGLYTPERRMQILKVLNVPDNRPIIVFIARMHPQKRPLDFLLIAQRFQPEEASFLLIGDGPLSQDLDLQIARLKLPHLYRYSFYRPAADIFAIADVVVNTSEYEGLPIALLEAQSMGCAAVATDVGAIKELLSYTEAGVVVERIGDISAFERGIRAVLANPPDPNITRARIIERFEIQHIASLYGEALG